MSLSTWRAIHCIYQWKQWLLTMIRHFFASSLYIGHDRRRLWIIPVLQREGKTKQKTKNNTRTWYWSEELEEERQQWNIFIFEYCLRHKESVMVYSPFSLPGATVKWQNQNKGRRICFGSVWGLQTVSTRKGCQGSYQWEWMRDTPHTTTDQESMNITSKVWT